jgi:hypothetical protein
MWPIYLLIMIDTLLLRLLVLYFVRRLFGCLPGYTKQKLKPNQHAGAHTIWCVSWDSCTKLTHSCWRKFTSWPIQRHYQTSRRILSYFNNNNTNKNKNNNNNNKKNKELKNSVFPNVSGHEPQLDLSVSRFLRFSSSCLGRSKYKA